ncbi:helix-turn-helix transcriptional regulator [Confluentibacter sediminis]|uniref:helix-turn-helix transcriptional regulator n=1 Tax=Confluentibacter sediminis TaxID=2219045 RepID=UPI000DAEA543|nr:hypothetical protein [Confluentibacter sediminis]
MKTPNIIIFLILILTFRNHKQSSTFKNTYIPKLETFLLSPNISHHSKELIKASKDGIKVGSIYKHKILVDKTSFLKTPDAADLNSTLTINNKNKAVIKKGQTLTNKLLDDSKKDIQIFLFRQRIGIILIVSTIIGSILIIKSLTKKINSLEQALGTVEKNINEKYTRQLYHYDLNKFENGKKLIELDLRNIKLKEELLKKNTDQNITSEHSIKLLEPHWQIFIDKFNNLNPLFVSLLKSRYPSLTSSDIELCSLIKLNLENREIALILNIEYRSVIIKKQRLKKKLKLTKNDSLENFVNTLK